MNNLNTITSAQLLDRLNWRYATKQFDPNRRIRAQDWATLEDALLLTPSSGGLPPWKFIVATDPAVRSKRLPDSYGQPQVTNAPHLEIFAAKKNFSEADVEAFISHSEICPSAQGAIPEKTGLCSRLNGNSRQNNNKQP